MKSGGRSLTDLARRAYAQRLFLATVLLLACVAVEAEGGGPTVRALALFKGKAMLEIDGRRQLLRDGETGTAGVRLVESTADRARVEVAGRISDLALDERIGGGFAAAPAPVVVRLLPAADGHYYVDGQIDGSPVRFLVDTGATAVAVSKHTARRVGLQYRVEGTPGTVQTAAGPAPAYGVVFDEVKVQAIRLTNVAGVVVDGDAPREPLLGQAVLNRLDLRREGTVMELRAR